MCKQHAVEYCTPLRVTRNVFVNIALRAVILFNATLYVYVCILRAVLPWKGVVTCGMIFCVKCSVGKISPREFREIRETSRRENFVGCFIVYYVMFFYKNAL